MTKYSNSNNSLYLNVYIDQGAQNIAANTTTVWWRMTVSRSGGYYTYNHQGDSTLYLSLDGRSVHSSNPTWNTSGEEYTLASGSSTISHNADGSKTLPISCTFNPNNGIHGTITVSANFSLTTIPRSSSVSLSAGIIGSPITINISRHSSSFKHTVRYVWGNKSGTIASNVDTSTTWMIPLDFANEIPNSTSGTGTIYVDTYAGSTKTGTQSAILTASVPGSMKPTFSSVTLTDTNGVARGLLSGNNFLQIISNIQVNFNGASGAYRSTITGYKAEIVNRNLVTNSNGGTLGMMNFNGSATIRASVVDSRGRQSDTRDITINVIEYFAPAFSFTAFRTRETPNIIQVVRNAKIAPITLSGSQKNVMTLSFRVAQLGSTSFTADHGSASGIWTTQHTLNNSAANMAGNYVASKSFVVIGTLSDKFTSTEFTATVATESVVMSYDKNGRVGIGKVAEFGKPGSLDVLGDIYADNKPIQQHQLTKNGGNSLSAEIDWNNYTDSGQYMGYNLLNSPQNGNSWKYVQVFKHNDNWVVQVVYDFDGQIAAVRAKTNGTWRPWKYLATKDDVQKYTQGTPWQNLPLQNGWQHHQQYNNVQYSKSFDGVVYLRGVGTKGKTAYGTVIAQLPVGFRPLHSTYVFALNDDFTVAFLCILTSGEIVVKNNVDATWLNFDNVSFKI